MSELSTWVTDKLSRVGVVCGAVERVNTGGDKGLVVGIGANVGMLKGGKTAAKAGVYGLNS